MKRFSKSIFLTILVIAMTIALVGCKSTAKVEEPVLAPSAPAEQPAAEQPAAEQPAAEAPAAEAPAEWIVPLLGYEAKIVYEDKVATITYPSFITDEEVYDAAAAAYAMYPAYFEGTLIEVDGGVAYITFPAEVSYEDLDAAVGLIVAELPGYIDSVLFPTIDRTVEVYGFEVSVSYKDKVAKITYPAVITRAEVADAAKTAYQAYSQYLEGTELSIGDGVAFLTFPVAITEEDIDYAVAMFSAYLPTYIEAVLAQEEAAVAVVAEEPAAEAPAEQPAAAPAAEAPAAAPAASSSTTTAPAASSSTTTAPAASASTAAAQASKGPNVVLIIAIIVLVLGAGAAVAIILKKKKG